MDLYLLAELKTISLKVSKQQTHDGSSVDIENTTLTFNFGFHCRLQRSTCKSHRQTFEQTSRQLIRRF